VSTRCSQTYQPRTAQLSLFGIPLWYSTNSPRVAIQVCVVFMCCAKSFVLAVHVIPYCTSTTTATFDYASAHRNVVGGILFLSCSSVHACVCSFMCPKKLLT